MRIGNWVLLIRTLEYIIQNPGLYNQTTWGAYSPECGTVRCVAGWLAHWGGWVDDLDVLGHPRGTVSLPGSGVSQVTVERAALISLELDPERHGIIPPRAYFAGEDEPFNYETNTFSASLFDGSLAWDEVLANVWDYAREDGVTLTPIIVAEMERHGITA